MAFTDRVAALNTALEDYARDMEADLGKIARNRVRNPNWEFVQLFEDPGHDIAAQHAHVASGFDSSGTRRREEYQLNINAVVDLIYRGVDIATLTAPEKAAASALRAKVTAFKAIRSLSEATAFVATF